MATIKRDNIKVTTKNDEGTFQLHTDKYWQKGMNEQKLKTIKTDSIMIMFSEIISFQFVNLGDIFLCIKFSDFAV